MGVCRPGRMGLKDLFGPDPHPHRSEDADQAGRNLGCSRPVDGFESCLPWTESPFQAKRGRSFACRLTNDWMVSGKPLHDVQTPEPVLHLTDPTETAYMVQGEGGAVTDLYASEVTVCGLEDEGQVQVLEGDGNQVLWAGTQLSDPNSNSDQEMRDRILQALASPSSPESESHGHGEELWQEQGQGEEEGDVVPPKEKYDSARMQGPDPRDERCVGAPCFGAHIPARPGPGSISGSNKFATWTGCCQCGIRLSYTPAYGAHGLTRKAGPLSKDVETALAKENPEKLKGTVKLKDAWTSRMSTSHRTRTTAT